MAGCYIRPAPNRQYYRSLTPEIFPAGFLKKRTDQLEQQLQQTRQQQAAQQQREQIVSEVNNFKKDHPDYDDALNYLVEMEMKTWDVTGGVNMLARQLLQNNRQGVE